MKIFADYYCKQIKKLELSFEAININIALKERDMEVLFYFVEITVLM